MEIKVALPKGRLLGNTAALLGRAGWGLQGYHDKTRLYRVSSSRFPALFLKVFQERDIPIQVAVGNYDLGICGLDWAEELLAKYPSSALVKVKNLGYGRLVLYMVAGRTDGMITLDEIKASSGPVRIASEYPNLAESFALKHRFRRFSVFPIWGAAEVYPPESADLAMVCCGNGESFNYGLVPLGEVLSSSAFLVANKNSWENKDMGGLLSSIYESLAGSIEPSGIKVKEAAEAGGGHAFCELPQEKVRLALPDGHQQPPTAELLEKAGIRIDDYPSKVGNRRPKTSFDWLSVKVIRPQDMPLQVANGNFDLAVTGRDWLLNHLYQFPSSPAKELLDLGMGRVKIVAVVNEGLKMDSIDSLRHFYLSGSTPLRIASEYTNIADKYARDNHLGVYRVIPTWGASEAFLPEDADLLIENTETGRTLERHKLQVLDTLFESTACLIGHRAGSPKKAERINFVVEALKKAVEADSR